MSTAYHANPNRLVFDGQSLNYLLTGPSANSFPNRLRVLLDAGSPGIHLTNIAVAGTPWDALTNRAPQKIPTLAGQAANTILVMNGGTSDILENDAAVEFYNDQRDYALAARAAGITTIVATTLVPSLDMTGPQNTARTAGNTLLLADVDAAFDAVIDLAADPSLANAGNTGGPGAVYSDGTHWRGEDTTGGCPIAAGIAAPIIEPLLT